MSYYWTGLQVGISAASCFVHQGNLKSGAGVLSKTVILFKKKTVCQKKGITDLKEKKDEERLTQIDTHVEQYTGSDTYTYSDADRLKDRWVTR